MDFRDYIELKDNNNIDFDHFLIDKKLNYLAIGDSISAGYNSKIGFQTTGYYDKVNNEFTGFSYPSYLCRLIQKTNPNFIENYWNLSFSNITSSQYLELLQSKNSCSEKLQKEMNLVKNFDSDPRNLFKDNLSHYFNGFNYEKGDFNIIKEKISQANLITISLGANDFTNAPFDMLKKYYNASNLGQRALIFSKLSDIWQSQTKKITENLIAIAKTIRSINPKTNIVFVGYPQTLVHFLAIFDKWLPNKDICNEKIADVMLGYVNSAIKLAANTTKNMYVNGADSKFWLTYKNYLYENIFDIHPTEKGYKHIAQNILLKLSLNDNFVQDNYANNNTNILQFLPTFSEYKKDFKSYGKILDFARNDQSLLVNILGLNRGDNLFLNDDYEKKYIENLKSQYHISWMLSKMEKEANFVFSSYLIDFVESKFSNAKQEYKTKTNLLNYLKDKDWAKQIFLALLENEHFDTACLFVQNQVLKNRHITLKDLREAKNEVIKKQTLIYAICSNLFGADFILESKEQLKQINYEFLTEILTTPLLSDLIEHELNPKFQNIRSYLSELNSFKEFADFLFMNFVFNLKKYSELSTFDEMWRLWLKQNHFKIIYYFDKILQEITTEQNYKKTIEFIKHSIFLIKKVDFKVSEKTDIKLEKHINNLLFFLENNKEKLNKFLVMVLKDAKNFSIFDYFFKAGKKQNRFKFLRTYIRRKVGFYFVTFKILNRIIALNLLVKKEKINNKKGKK